MQGLSSYGAVSVAILTSILDMTDWIIDIYDYVSAST